MPTIEDRIRVQEEKLKQLKALHAKQEAQKRAVESKKARKEQDRKKILVGAMILEQMERSETTKSSVLNHLSSFLKRDDERALFGFAPLPKGQTEAAAQAQQAA